MSANKIKFALFLSKNNSIYRRGFLQCLNLRAAKDAIAAIAGTRATGVKAATTTKLKEYQK